MSDLYIKRESKEWGDKMEPATPSEIAAAHPKCGTCGHRRVYEQTGHVKCKNPNSIAYDRAMMPSEYCPHHTELTGESDGQLDVQ